MTDPELLALYKQTGKMEALGELYSRYTSLVYGVCMKYLKNREESRDAVMQIFEKLTVTLREHDVANFKSWLYVIVRNHCLMDLRARKGKNFEEISSFLMETDGLQHQDDSPELETDLGKLDKCIKELGDEQRHCVQLFYLEQKCYKEITDATGYDFKQVKSYIQNGKRKLRLCMERNG